MSRFAVIGLGRFGRGLARALTADGAEVIAVDRNPKLVEAVRDEVTVAVRLDSTDAEALRAQGIAEVDLAIVGIGEQFESAALTVAVLRELGVPRIYARAESDIQGQILSRIGAHEIVNPEQESALEPSADLGLDQATKQFQREFIRRSVKRVRGNMSESAKLLGVHRSNLYRKMRQLKMKEVGGAE